MTAAQVAARSARTGKSASHITKRSLIGLALVAIGLAALLRPAPEPGLSASAAREAAASTPARSEQEALDVYGKLPLAFVPNAGQTDSRVRYSAHAAGASFYFTPREAVFAFMKGKKGSVLRLAFVGANPQPKVEGKRLRAGRVNYLIGSDSEKWRTNLPTYGQVVYRELWPGIDLAFRGEGGKLKYEFRVAPSADPAQIRLAYRGADGLALGRAGALRIHTPLGVLTDTRPLSYQEVGGERVPVGSRFVLDRRGDSAYGFAIGSYDTDRPLVIDPGLLYSTFLGGAFADLGLGIAVDAVGNAYVTGRAGSPNFPTTPGAFDPLYNGGQSDVFVTKLNPAGSAPLLYSTFLGGFASDVGRGIAVDGLGNAYVTGETSSPNFPISPGAFDPFFNGNSDAFVTKLNPVGSFPLYSTFLGGFAFDSGQGIAVDGLGNAYVAGATASPNFPITPGAFDPFFNGGSDAFVTKLNPVGSFPLLYSTFLGGFASDSGRGIAVDGFGNAYVTGETASPNFPITPGAFDPFFNGGSDAFVTKLNPVGSFPLYSTFLGGFAFDSGQGVAVDGFGSAYVTGRAGSPNFPTTPGAFDPLFNGGPSDVFVTKLNPVGSFPLLYSTFLGGLGDDVGFGVAVDGFGNAYVTGETSSPNFPTTPGAFDTTVAGTDAFVTKLNPVGSAPLLYSTFLGGSGIDRGRAIDADAAGNAYVTGETNFSNFPTTPGAFDTGFNGSFDAFVTKLDLIPLPTPATVTLSPLADTNPAGTSHTVTATVRDGAGTPMPGVTVRFSVTGANSASGSDVTDTNGEAAFTYTGTTAGTDTISAFADTDNDGTQDVGEPSGAATKVWTPGPPATLTLTPTADTDTAGTPHTVTATVEDAFGNPVAGVTVRFSVSGANSASGSQATDASGQASFTYTGTTAGTDTISAFADSDNDGMQDVGEPSGAATKVWTPGAPATLTLDPQTDTNPVGNPHTVTATVEDQFGNATPGIVVRFSVSGANSASGTNVTDANGQTSFTYTGFKAGTDTISAFADTDNDGTQDAGEPSDTATKTWTPGPPATLALAPKTDTNTVGTTHCVTATVEDTFGNPVPGVTVRFSVPTGVATHASPSSGSATTDANGQATFCYTASLPGADAIHAFADTNGNGQQNAGEPFDDAAKTWILPPSTPLCEVTISDGGRITAANGDKATFGGHAKVPESGAPDGHQTYQDHGPAQPMTVESINVLAVVCSADRTQADLYGQATIDDSGSFFYRIQVNDLGEPGKGIDQYWILLSSGYNSGLQTLEAGNVQITVHE